MAKVKKVRALELIMDWGLWPRYEANDLDLTNVRRMKEAIEAGEELPPIIADVKSQRIIDGFHRVKAYHALYGEDAKVPVEFRHYENEMDMFLEAARLNTVHGLPLSPKDKVHVLLTAKKNKIPLVHIAEALQMRKETAEMLLTRRTATTRSGERIPLAAGAMSLAGKKLTTKQEKFAKTANGILPIINARLLINALNAGAAPLTDTEVQILFELRDAIDKALAGNEVAA